MLFSQPKIKVGFVIYTYDKTDDARINLELVNSLWRNNPKFSQVQIVHSYNGLTEWYPQKYLEDILISGANPGHFRGASELIDRGVEHFNEINSDIDYLVITAADTWLTNPNKIHQIMVRMRKQEQYLASCSWGNQDNNNIFTTGMATDFFIVDWLWSQKFKFFPLDYESFNQKYADIILYTSGDVIFLEKIAQLRFSEATRRQFNIDHGLKNIILKHFYRLSEREPIHIGYDDKHLPTRQDCCQPLGIINSHNIINKKKLLSSITNIKNQATLNITKLLTSKDVTYFNNH